MHDFLVMDAQKNIEILLKFALFDDIQYQITAFWALKDYILLSSDNLISDISKIVNTFIVGCVHEEPRI